MLLVIVFRNFDKSNGRAIYSPRNNKWEDGTSTFPDQ